MDALTNRPWVWGLGLFLVALLLRLAGIGWGLPDDRHHWSYHPDEPVVWAYSQEVKPAEGKFTPGFYNYGTLYLTLVRVATDVVNAYGGGPKERDGSDLPRAMAHYHLAGRLLSALAGAGLAWVTFAILWRRAHVVGALVAGLGITVAPGLVVHSRFQTVDVLATFLLTLGLHYALKLAPEPEGAKPGGRKEALLAGLFCGLSAGTKYTGLLGLVALAVACAWTKKWKELAWGVGACLAAFVFTTPGLLLDVARFWRGFAFEMAHTSVGHGLVFAGTPPGFLYHLGNLSIGLGSVFLVLGAAGLARASWRRHGWAAALAAFGLVYFGLIGRAEVKFLRYTFPLMPVLAIGTGWAVGRAHVHPDRKWKLVGAASILGLGGFLGGGFALSAQATSAMAGSDVMGHRGDPREFVLTGDLAAAQGRTVGLVSDPWFYTPDFYAEAGAPRWIPPAYRDSQMRAARPWILVRYLPSDPSTRQDWDVRLLDLMPDFVCYSSFETEGVDRLAASGYASGPFAAQVGQYKAFMERLQREYDLSSVTDPVNPFVAVHDLMYIRPTLWVWKRKTTSPTASTGSSTISGSSGAPANTR